MRTFKLTLSYDGTAYAGWQIQAGVRTIQAELERALQTILGQPIRAVASGRTDAGVHALGQVVSFVGATRLTPETLRKALNANLPPDIAVRDCREVHAAFHALRDAVCKRYRYLIHDEPVRDVFCRAYVWQIPQPLDVSAMQTAAQTLRGTHDFASFETSGSERLSTVRTISDILVRRCAGECSGRIEIEVEANGFLYNMVRNIVGTLVDVGRRKHPPAKLAEVLAARDRRAAGATAPPQGLFLVRVSYGAALD